MFFGYQLTSYLKLGKFTAKKVAFPCRPHEKVPCLRHKFT